MKLTNGYILIYTETLVEEILSNDRLKFPAKVSYIIQRNYKKLLEIAQDILKAKVEICEEYSTSKENDVYRFDDKEKMYKANEELTGLMSVEQEVNILTFDIAVIEDLSLTSKQMEILMLMINGEE